MLSVDGDHLGVQPHNDLNTGGYDLSVDPSPSVGLVVAPKVGSSLKGECLKFNGFIGRDFPNKINSLIANHTLRPLQRSALLRQWLHEQVGNGV